ncbi:MAG: beta-galactosidase [Ruminococcus sp.]
MKADFKHILYGGDYNPNQCPEAVWKEDMELFDKARINSATVNVFSWQSSSRQEERYDFEELDKVIEMLGKNHKDIVLATCNCGNAGLDVSEISGGGKDGLCGKAPQVWTEAKCMPK